MPQVRAGACAMGTLAWRYRGVLSQTVVVKASYAISANGALEQVAPEPIHRHDVPSSSQPMASPSAPSDWVPYRTKADVTLVGHAFAPPGQTVTHSEVTLAVSRGGQPLLRKTLQVVGDRIAGEPQPFSKTRLSYERAYGGIGHKENPVGIGALAGDDPPAITLAGEPQQVAGLGPIPALWKLRSQYFERKAQRALDAPVALLPDDIDWRFFQCAPTDQWTDCLAGDETITLLGLHPDAARVEVKLPRLFARAVVFGLAGTQATPVQLLADGLHVDSERARLTITWRGHQKLPEGVESSTLLIAAGVGSSQSPLELPDTRASAEALQAEPGQVVVAAPADQGASSAGEAMDFTGTMHLGAEAEAAMAGQPLPFQPAASSTPPPRAEPLAEPERHPEEGQTEELKPDAATRSKLEAAADLAMAKSAASPAPPTPGAEASEPASPWAASAPAPSAPPPAPASPSTPPAPAPRPASASPLAPASPAVPPAAALPSEPAAVAHPRPATTPALAAAVQLLWSAPEALERARAEPRYRDLAQDPQASAQAGVGLLSAAALGLEDPHSALLQLLAAGVPLDGEALGRTMHEAVRESVKLVPPLALLAGVLELSMACDELLRVTTEIAEGLGADEPQLAALLAEARVILATPVAKHRPVVDELVGRIRTTFAQAHEALGVDFLEGHSDRVLTLERAYERRQVLGGPHVCGTLTLAGPSGPIPLYLPEEALSALPLHPRIDARVLVEVHLRQEAELSSALALRVLAVARQATAGAGEATG